MLRKRDILIEINTIDLSGNINFQCHLNQLLTKDVVSCVFINLETQITLYKLNCDCSSQYREYDMYIVTSHMSRLIMSLHFDTFLSTGITLVGNLYCYNSYHPIRITRQLDSNFNLPEPEVGQHGSIFTTQNSI